MFFAALWSVYNFYLLNESIKSTMQQNYASITAADNMAKSLDEQLQAFIIIFNQDYERGDLLFTRSRDDFFYWYEKSREAVATNEERDILDSLNTGYNNFITSVGDIIDYRVYERSSDLTKFNFFIIADQIKNLKRHSNRILEINHDILNETASNVKEITQTATIFMVVILLGAIVVSVLFSTQFSDYVVQPLKNLRKSVEHIAEGHFDERIEIDENSDEIITLAEEFNKMSERLQKYEQLNLSKILFEKKKSELTIESMNEPVLMVDENYNVLLANKTFNEVFGEEYRDKERIEKLLGTKIIQGDESDKEIKNVYAAQDTITLKNSSGSQQLFKVIAASLELPETGTKGTVIVFNDITKYQELDKMKSEFIAKVSHELKTPLTSLGMALGIIEDGVVGRLTSKQKELVFSMKEDYERLNKLVYEILELTKLEANTDKIKFEKTETHKLVEYISKKFGILTTEKNIGLKIIDNSEGAFINCSFIHMVSAIENLLSNSLRFTPVNGEITYMQSVRDGNLLVEISDTGIGIGPDNLKKIFDKFIQIDDSAPGSLGLGLSIAKEIIEIHKGEIKAFSELGKGSTFQIKIPVA